MAKRPMEEVVEEIVRLLYEAKADEWSIQDKGVLMAAVKLQLAEKKAGEKRAD